MLATQATTTNPSLENNRKAATAVTSIKRERRDSTTSESSLEHLDLGHTPKKFQSLTSTTSTPHIANGVGGANSSIIHNSNNSNVTAITAAAVGECAISITSATTLVIADAHKKQPVASRLQLRMQDSDDANDYDEDESADEKHSSTIVARPQRHHKRRRLDKRASVQLEYNPDNPNSLRKKFRFNRSSADVATASGTSLTNNESGFVDASCSSQYLNASAAGSTTATGAQQSQASPRTSSSTSASHSSSSASSSPHGAGAGVSSPESGIGEREDMKFVCPICEVVSGTPHEFTNHIRCHNYASGDTEHFTCAICSKVLSSASSLDRHVLVHTGERPFNCKYCQLTFTTNGNMHRHMRTHKQHQHNHHRRNSNGTKNNNSSSAANNNSNNNNISINNTSVVGTTTQTTPVTEASLSTSTPATAVTAVTNAALATTTYAQLTNGGINERGVKTASTATTTTLSTAAVAAAAAGANGKLLNGSGVESYESDGGCSTDSSSSNISQGSNNHNNNNNNNNNNMKANNNNSSSTSNNYSSNNKNNIINNVSNVKRKNSDQLDVDDIALMKRRVKTTINNNTIGASDENHQQKPHQLNSAADVAPSGIDEQRAPLYCPVCSAVVFPNMSALSVHIETEHSDIPAKCRYCGSIFRSYRQLNVHPCRQKPKAKVGPKDLLSNPDYSCVIARPLPNQRFDCAKCFCTFLCSSDLETHEQECSNETLHLDRMKRRNLSESSAGGEEADEEQQRREFFRQLYLKNKELHTNNMNSMSSPQNSGDENLETIKLEDDNEKISHNISQQSHDSKDLADIQSILNMTSSSSTSNFFKNFEQSVNTPSSNYSLDKDEEEAQDVFTSEFRKMKLRGEFPCKLCSAVFPNLRALKGHNRIHLSAAGPAGPFRCNMCPYSICDKAALVRHMRTHNGDRPYECAVCNYAFTTKANCERHLRNRHAKTTRDEVKRAIIYHPSEDSSCDDTTKKMHMFLSPDFDDDSDYQYQHQQPKDRSTPVSHLKEMLTSESPTSKPMIQVKSLEQLRDKSTSSATSYNETYNDQQAQIQRTPDTAPIDLSMDVLDLSKKPAIKEKTEKRERELAIERRPETPPAPTLVPESISIPLGGPTIGDAKFDLSNLEKNQQLLLAQQQLMNDTIPKLDPAHYFQQFYRNLVFPPLNPFFLQSHFLPNNLNDLQKFAPLMSRMFGAAPPGAQPQLSNIDVKKGTGTNASSSPAPSMLPQVSPLMSEKPGTHTFSSPAPASINQLLPKSLTSAASSNASLSISRHSQIPPTVLPGGPVKMVLKNGVFMPKQKQRRYRTERPFACEHCSARFTLRSNMERHIKQQHPEFYAHRQRSGHHIMRGRGASSAAAMNNITHLQAAFAQAHNNSGSGGHMNSPPISDQVKYAILAQQLKARKDTDLLQQALAHGSSSVSSNHMLLNAAAGAGIQPLPNGHQLNLSHHLSSTNTSGGLVEDDEPKLIIDEDDDYDDVEEVHDENEDEQQENELNDSISEDHLPLQADEVKEQTSESNEAAKKVAKTILEEAIKESTHKSSSTIVKPEAPGPPANSMKSMIAQAESVGKFLKEVASSPFKDESQDLVSVSKLVDNATSNAVSFNNYFRPSDVANNMEQSDEEGLVASGSASESNNSGTEDIATSVEPKKKSAYSLAPNRVSCPYCQRMFPWSSSLRRHILTHTGQKPFKCSHCPLLFTTKSNCDRHLMRKHGNVESAVSVYVPTEDVSEPIPVPKSVEEIEQQQRQREEDERRRKAEQAQQDRERREKENRQQHEQEQQQQLLSQLAAAQINQLNAVAAAAVNSQNRLDINTVSSSDLPFKCHLCENSFGERIQCLEHIKIQHARDFALLLAKGAIDTDAESSQYSHHSEDMEERRAPTIGDDSNGERVRTGGRYPDYSNRKVICAFCMRRFWSTEDLRRHMRTHSGERPYQCEVCMRKFTLKHSMLRHMKKHDETQNHNGGSATGDLSAAGNSGSDFSDDEQTSSAIMPTATTPANPNVSNALRAPKIQELLSKANEWRTSRLAAASTLGEQKENIAEEPNNQSDLIGNLLGISDQGILNKLLSSADEAAKFLGVEK